jgi:hypothetical protein
MDVGHGLVLCLESTENDASWGIARLRPQVVQRTGRTVVDVGISLAASVTAMSKRQGLRAESVTMHTRCDVAGHDEQPG